MAAILTSLPRRQRLDAVGHDRIRSRAPISLVSSPVSLTRGLQPLAITHSSDIERQEHENLRCDCFRNWIQATANSGGCHVYRQHPVFPFVFQRRSGCQFSIFACFLWRAAEKQKCLQGVSATINMAPHRGLVCAQKQSHIEPAEECGQGQAINASAAERAGAARDGRSTPEQFAQQRLSQGRFGVSDPVQDSRTSPLCRTRCGPGRFPRTSRAPLLVESPDVGSVKKRRALRRVFFLLKFLLRASLR